MKILVYGAGNIGRLYAALLKQSGQDVSILARGKRLADIREHGIRLEDSVNGKQTTTRVRSLERLEADDGYDLVLVILPKNHISEILPVLATNRQTPSVVFFGNNAAGPEQMIEVLGRDRVLLGFPGSSAVARAHIVRYLILSSREQPTTIGELDGARSPRIEATAAALKASGFPVSIESHMDAWLKTHVAEISPTANALFMAGGDLNLMARNREVLGLMVRAIREGYKVLRAHGIPVTPGSHRMFNWLPEALLVALIGRMAASKEAAIKIGHAHEARAEMRCLADEFQTLAGQTAVPTPAIDQLCEYGRAAAQPAAPAVMGASG